MNTPKNTKNPVWVVVPAAGLGRRMGAGLPKQYLPLLGKTVIEHTLEKLVALDAIAGVMVALNARDQQFASLPIAHHPKIATTQGGEERSDSVLAALMSLQKKIKLSDWVLVHDAVRCCIRPGAIQALLAALAEDAVGGILAVPASDTLKKVGDDQAIVTTLNRSRIWQAQTPQAFRYDLLRESLQSALQQGCGVTDEASAIEMAGYSASVVMGHYDNIKITHPEDLVIAAAILQQQKQQYEQQEQQP